MKDLSDKLLSIVGLAEGRLRKMSADESSRPVLQGGWSRKQVLGHLIDSASNNHQRFVRACLAPSLDFPAYDQDGNIRVEAPEDADWTLLITLWAAYNRYLAHLIARLPADRLETLCRIGSDDPVTLGFVATDYVRHMVHHLKQIGVTD